jgi:hypothetical protein
VERAVEGDDAAAPGVGAGDLDGVFNRFGAGVHEEGLFRRFSRRQCVQTLGEADVGFVGDDLEAGVGKVVELRAGGGHDLRVAVAGVDHRDAGTEIDPATALDVPYFGVLGAHGKHAVCLRDAARQCRRAPRHQGVVGLGFQIGHQVHLRVS